jgi:DNA phosphorothioation-dependent restriction protein DptG
VYPRELSLPAISNKDKPPSYNELYSNQISSNKDNHDQLRQTSPCPPDYFIINNENTSSQSIN